jgi:carboxyl-terminal processing protease
MLSDTIGYIKINRFSYKTNSEFKHSAKTLKNKGARKLIIDVRDNPGGSLNSVIDICEDLLPKGRNIVYTKGENEQESYNSQYDGDFATMTLTVLINQNSASASEILAGALQDNDKATIIGRRTFGKGLVQSVINLQDKSRIHLTIARYYIPSGRCIQKPFIKDDIDSYRGEELNRWENGELYHKDSIKIIDTTLYKTIEGRTVYGGGGVIPDVFVPLDTTMNSNLLFDIIKKSLISNYAIKFFTPKKLSGVTYEECTNSLKNLEIEKSFTAYCKKSKVTWDAKDWQTSKDYVLNRLHGYILRVKFGNNGFYRKISENDNDITEALRILSNSN